MSENGKFLKDAPLRCASACGSEEGFFLYLLAPRRALRTSEAVPG